MTFDEELLADNRFLQLNAPRQSEIISIYCVTIEERIRKAPSRLEALRIAESSCGRFKEVCSSTLVQNALERHVEDLILQYWEHRNS